MNKISRKNFIIGAAVAGFATFIIPPANAANQGTNEDEGIVICSIPGRRVVYNSEANYFFCDTMEDCIVYNRDKIKQIELVYEYGLGGNGEYSKSPWNRIVKQEQMDRFLEGEIQRIWEYSGWAYERLGFGTQKVNIVSWDDCIIDVWYRESTMI